MLETNPATQHPLSLHMCPGHLTATAEPDTPQDLTENTRKWETDQEILWSELLPSALLQTHQGHFLLDVLQCLNVTLSKKKKTMEILPN